MEQALQVTGQAERSEESSADTELRHCQTLSLYELDQVLRGRPTSDAYTEFAVAAVDCVSQHGVDAHHGEPR